MTTADDVFRAQAHALIARMLHHGAYHPHSARGPAMDLGDILDTPERVEYTCWVIARSCAVAAASHGGHVRVVPGTRDEHGALVEAPDIDATAPTHRAAVRFMSSAANCDPETAHAVYLTIPADELGRFLRGILATTVDVVRLTGWGAH